MQISISTHYIYITLFRSWCTVCTSNPPALWNSPSCHKNNVDTREAAQIKTHKRFQLNILTNHESCFYGNFVLPNIFGGQNEWFIQTGWKSVRKTHELSIRIGLMTHSRLSWGCSELNSKSLLLTRLTFNEPRTAMLCARRACDIEIGVIVDWSFMWQRVVKVSF